MNDDTVTDEDLENVILDYYDADGWYASIDVDDEVEYLRLVKWGETASGKLVGMVSFEGAIDPVTEFGDMFTGYVHESDLEEVAD